jgi:hypothetical protein
MKMLWCWRCKAEMPMLDEDEYGEIARLYKEAMSATKEFRQLCGISLEGASIEQRFQPVRTHYERLTGMKECHENAILHHRRSLYGHHVHIVESPFEAPRLSFVGVA